jgi:putative transposase
MNRSILKLVQWFCRQINFNELASAVIIFHEVLNGSRSDISLKPADKPPHYRDFRIDTIPPLPAPIPEETPHWKTLKAETEKRNGTLIKPIKTRSGKELPAGTRCSHCNAPKHYLYLNNGKLASQTRCKICGKTSSLNQSKHKQKAKYYCPHCSYALFKWKTNVYSTIYKCPNSKCSHYLSKKQQLTNEEQSERSQEKYNPNYKLHYQYREYHLSSKDIETQRPVKETHVDLRKIHNSYHTLGLILSLTINLGLSSRITRDALKGLFGISVSHQTVINYVNATAGYLSDYVDQHLPVPKSTCAADETYIIVDGKWNYTWFIIDSDTRAICGYNLSQTRGAIPAIGLLNNCFNNATYPPDLITDGNPSYDAAVMAYNASVNNKTNELTKRTVIGLKNLDSESTEYRSFKQLVERLNRTYKYHTRPRAGFKSFDGATSLTTLFVAYYNFIRPHATCDHKPPVILAALKDQKLYPAQWVALLQEAA